MVFLSPHFAILACLCAALPIAFPPSVGAAYLHRNSADKRTSSHYPLQNNAQAYGHDGGHKAPHQRAPELPPLLRRHNVHAPVVVRDYQHLDARNATHGKSPWSVFARSRPRRKSGLNRRSAVYVSGEHGGWYMVSGMPSEEQGDVDEDEDRHAPHTLYPRQVNDSNISFGRVDIMGEGQSTDNAQRLASLAVDSIPIDWTSGRSSAKAFRLNASTTNQTQFMMIPVNDPSDRGGFDKYVTLATEVFNASSAELVKYCATYDSNPSTTSSLVMMPCMDRTIPVASEDKTEDPCSDEGDDDGSSDGYQSQIFLYDPFTGKIRPISAVAGSSGNDDIPNRSAVCVAARVRRASGDSTTSGSTTSSAATRSRTSTSSAPTASAPQRAQNVTLVYVAGALEVPASSPSPSTARALGKQAAVLTTTITTTIVTTVTAATTSSQTISPTPARAAVSLTVSSSPSVTATPTPSSLPVSPSSATTATRTASRVPAMANASLQVEVVGLEVSATGSSSSAPSTASTTTSPNSSPTPSPSAQVIASPVANVGLPQRRAFASGSIKVNHV